MSRRRILVTLADLHGGGAQRFALTLLRNLPRDRFELHLALVQKVGAFVPEIPPDVEVHDLGASRVRTAVWPLVSLVRRLRPDAVFSTLFHLNQMVIGARFLFPHTTRVVVREGITVSRAKEYWRGGRLHEFGLRWLYPRADSVVCQCNYMADDLAAHAGIPRERMATIYNPIDVDWVRARAASDANPFAAHGPGPHLVGAGRLHPQKGFDDLIRRFADFSATRPDARLWLLGEDTGDGSQLAALQEQARISGVEGYLQLPGFVANPHAYLAHADLFVLSSRYEGLPNVLLEAIALGCPVVALDRPGGTREVMELTGLAQRLVPELEWRTEWLQRGAQPADLSRFSLERTISEYADVLIGDESV